MVKMQTLRLPLVRSSTIFALALVVAGAAAAAAAVVPGSVPIPALPAGQQPNIIFILADDQGFDDFGLRNPRYLNTPNMDKFLVNSLRFDNFYVASQCAQTRAMLLTGRHHARVGTMLTNSGSDLIHHKEATIAQLAAAGGYYTAHFGKWHNADVQGYAPLDVGFKESSNEEYISTNQNPYWSGGYGLASIAPGAASQEQQAAAAPRKSLIMVNNQYQVMDTTVLPAETLNNLVMTFLQQADGGQKPRPFFLYYALHAIHTPRVYPDKYWQKFLGPNRDPKYNAVRNNTLDCWAYAEYMDEFLGTLFNFLESSSLRKDTVIMFTSDNGPDEHTNPGQDLYRLPSGMIGHKSTVYEGGTRQTLAVQGPGLPVGMLDSTLLQIIDIFPTLADLGGFSVNSVPHLPLDGISFSNLLTAAGSSNARPEGAYLRRDGSLTTKEQQERFVFHLAVNCWNANALPLLNASRQIKRPQQLFDYDVGGTPYTGAGNVLGTVLPKDHVAHGFGACISIRYKGFKWLGYTGTVYRLTATRHVELPAYVVSGDQGNRLKTMFQATARQWWSSIVNSDHSFTRGQYLLGLEPWNVSNVLANSPLFRNSKNIQFGNLVTTGFVNTGERLCWPLTVVQAGTYDVIILYMSNRVANFRLGYGVYADIVSRRETFLTVQLPVQSDKLRGYLVGTMTLASSKGVNTELCLELINSPAQGTPVFTALADVRFVRNLKVTTAGASTEGQTLTQALSNAARQSDGLAGSVDMSATTGQQGIHVAVPAAALDINGECAWLKELLQPAQGSASSSGPNENSSGDELKRVRTMIGWPDGQGPLCELMYNPRNVEDCDEDCQVPI